MHNDLVPEEQEQEYRQLLTVLRSASAGQQPITATEQAQIIARVRERLEQAMYAAPRSAVGVLAPQRPSMPHRSMGQTRQRGRLPLNMLAAAVVIGLIVGSWVLFKAYPSSRKAHIPTAVSSSGPVAVAQAGGLEVSMHVLIGGPYFLSELLPVDVPFTNHTQRPVGLDGSVRITNNSIANACFPSELLVQVTKGSNPSYTFPELSFACIQPYIVTEVKPGQTITIHQYVPLTKSEKVMLTTGIVLPGSGGDPLDRHWPAVHMRIQVNPQPPQNRILAIQTQYNQVIIGVPAGAKPRLLYMQTLSCGAYHGGNTQWTPLATHVLPMPSCSAAQGVWEYIVSAPGYTIIYGEATFTSVSGNLIPCGCTPTPAILPVHVKQP
jgi:hypothetical protein